MFRSLNDYLDPIDAIELGDRAGIGLMLENTVMAADARVAVIRRRAIRATSA